MASGVCFTSASVICTLRPPVYRDVDREYDRADDYRHDGNPLIAGIKHYGAGEPENQEYDWQDIVNHIVNLTKNRVGVSPPVHGKIGYRFLFDGELHRFRLLGERDPDSEQAVLNDGLAVVDVVGIRNPETEVLYVLDLVFKPFALLRGFLFLVGGFLLDTVENEIVDSVLVLLGKLDIVLCQAGNGKLEDGRAVFFLVHVYRDVYLYREFGVGVMPII